MVDGSGRMAQGSRLRLKAQGPWLKAKKGPRGLGAGPGPWVPGILLQAQRAFLRNEP